MQTNSAEISPQFLLVVVVVRRFSCVQIFAAPWTVGQQAPLSMGFSQPEYWSGLPFPPPGDRPSRGIETASPASPALQVVLYR